MWSSRGTTGDSYRTHLARRPPKVGRAVYGHDGAAVSSTDLPRHQEWHYLAALPGGRHRPPGPAGPGPAGSRQAFQPSAPTRGAELTARSSDRRVQRLPLAAGGLLVGADERCMQVVAHSGQRPRRTGQSRPAAVAAALPYLARHAEVGVVDRRLLDQEAPAQPRRRQSCRFRRSASRRRRPRAPRPRRGTSRWPRRCPGVASGAQPSSSDGSVRRPSACRSTPAWNHTIGFLLCRGRSASWRAGPPQSRRRRHALARPQVWRPGRALRSDPSCCPFVSAPVRARR